MHRQVKNAMIKINLREKIRQVRDQKPLILIDMFGFTTMWCKKSFKETLCGGRTEVFHLWITNFIRELVAAGARLIFIEDYYTPIEEYETWLQLAEKKYQAGIELIDLVETEPSLHELSRSQIAFANFSNINKIYMAIFWKIAKKFGEVAYIDNLTRALASYAFEKNAFAILTDREDFLAFNGEFKLWNLKHLDFKTFETIEYDKRALQHSVNLSPRQFHLLAAMTIHESVTIEDVTQLKEIFHCDDDQLLNNVAQYIRISTSEIPNDDEVFAVALALNEDEDRSVSLRNAYNYYNQPNVYKDDKQDDEFSTKLLDVGEYMSYLVFKNCQTYYTILIEDLRKDDIPFWIPKQLSMLQKFFGIILFHETKTDAPVTRRVITKFSHETPYEALDLPVIFPPFEVPPLNELLLTPRKLEPEELENKLKILNWVLDLNLTKDQIMKMPLKYVISAISVLLMVKNFNLELKEADVFILSCYKATSVSDDFKPPSQLNPRAFRLVFLFARVSSNVRRALDFMGYHQVMENFIFDGYLFHVNYNRMTMAAHDERFIGIQEVPESMKLYESLYPREN